MDNYFIEALDWDRCANPINAIEFSIDTAELEKLAAVLEMVGLPLYEDVSKTLDTNRDDYLSLDVGSSYVKLVPCSGRIAPIPVEDISIIVPALILAHKRDPESVKQAYNDYFINKKEEITPLLDE